MTTNLLLIGFAVTIAIGWVLSSMHQTRSMIDQVRENTTYVHPTTGEPVECGPEKVAEMIRDLDVSELPFRQLKQLKKSMVHNASTIYVRSEKISEPKTKAQIELEETIVEHMEGVEFYMQMKQEKANDQFDQLKSSMEKHL